MMKRKLLNKCVKLWKLNSRMYEKANFKSKGNLLTVYARFPEIKQNMLKKKKRQDLFYGSKTTNIVKPEMKNAGKSGRFKRK